MNKKLLFFVPLALLLTMCQYPPTLSSNWTGEWLCITSEHEMFLTVSGDSAYPSMKGYYPKAFGDMPANEEYIIESLSNKNASGEYIYFDSNPEIGYQNKIGVFKGEWSITYINDDELKLIRQDHLSSWLGEYECKRK